MQAILLIFKEKSIKKLKGLNYNGIQAYLIQYGKVILFKLIKMGKIQGNLLLKFIKLKINDDILNIYNL